MTEPAGNNIKKKKKNHPGFHSCWFTPMTLGLPPARSRDSGTCVWHPPALVPGPVICLLWKGKRIPCLSWRQSSLPAPALGVPWKDTQAPSAGQRAGIPPQPEQPSLIARGYEDQRFSTPTSRVPCKQGKGAPVGVHAASPGCSRRSRWAAPSWESRGQRPAAWSEVCLVFRLELYTNIHVPRGPNTYTPVHLSTYLHLPKGKGQRKGRPEEKDKDHGWEGPWRAGKESWDCGTGGACKVEPKGHAEAGGSTEEPVK